MNITKIIDTLTKHNEWRRGGNGESTDPKLLGEAIDCAIAALSARDAEIARLQSRLEISPEHSYDGIDCRDATIRELEARVDRQDNALEKLDQWAQAYPISVFPEPDWKRAAEVLKAAGMTIDSISASNMRHVITGVQKIVQSVLAAPCDPQEKRHE